MRKRISLILASVLIIAAAVVVVVFLTREQKIPLSQVPIDVINVLNEKLPGGEVVSVVMEKEDDEILYEIVKKIDGIEHEVDIRADGKIEKIEKAGEESEESEEDEEDEENEDEDVTLENEKSVLWKDSFDMGNRTFSSTGRNQYFILEPGYQLVLKGKDGKDDVHLIVTVLKETKKIGDTETRIVEEREFENDELVEISRNFFAIDIKTGDVFYFGEEVDIYKDGKVTGHEGAWIAGTGNARAGLMMPKTVHLGSRYYQEIAPGIAMDRAEVISLSETLETPAGVFENCLKIAESSALEPGKEYKMYAAGIGLIKDEDLLLTKYGFIPQK